MSGAVIKTSRLILIKFRALKDQGVHMLNPVMGWPPVMSQ